MSRQEGVVKYWLDAHSAIVEASERLSNEDLQGKVKKAFETAGLDLPEPLKWDSTVPLAALLRHIPSARLEELQFSQIVSDLSSKKIPLEAAIFTYIEDRFVPENPSKSRLCTIHGYLGRGKRGGVKQLGPIKLADTERNRGRKMFEVMTLSGKPLIDFHRQAFERFVGLRHFDISDWLNRAAEKRGEDKKAKGYYPYIFLLAAAGRLVIFESFESPGFPHLNKFNDNIVIPSRDYTVSVLGVEPIIVYHPSQPDPVWGETEWVILNHYPPEIIELALKDGWV